MKFKIKNCHSSPKTLPSPVLAKIALVGNPNVGKSVIFGFLTGSYANVSNYPGTTVEVSRGHTVVGGKRASVMDTPGINSLTPMSEDEQVTRDILLNEKIGGIIQVADAKNLKRALLISLELAETGIPFMLDLNMEDESAARGITIDKEKLSSILGVPIVGTVAIHKKGLGELKKKILHLKPPEPVFKFSPEIEEAVKKIEPLLPPCNLRSRSMALMLLSGDKTLVGWLHQKLFGPEIEKIIQVKNELADRLSGPLAYVINKQRFAGAGKIMDLVTKNEVYEKKGLAHRLGHISTHPFWGIFVLVAVLFALYEFVGNFGAQMAVGWLEEDLFANHINPWAEKFFSAVFFFSPFLRDLFVGPYGVITMALTYALAIILPIVTTFFLFFSLLEDSGYLPRLAIMLNRVFKFMGLNGKAVVPMVLGLGCDTMATMSARIMEKKKEKIILTLLLALGIPCSAQLGIILGMLGSLPAWSTFLWLGVVAGSLVIVGFLASLVLPGGRSDFFAEIPPIRRPALSNIITKTLARLEWYLKEVVPLFVIGTFTLFILDKLNWLEKIEAFSRPLVTDFLHLPPQAAQAFLIGFLRRDYGATRFFDMFGKGEMDAVQATTALVVMTLFVPCLANTLMIIKERGGRIAAGMMGFIYPYAFLVGGLVNMGLRWHR